MADPIVEAASRPQHKPPLLSDLLRNHSPILQVVDREFAWNMGEIVKLIARRGGRGTVNLSIAVEKEDDGRVMLTVNQEMKPPKNAEARTLAYVGDNGSLHKDPPYQISADEIDWMATAEQPLTDHQGAPLVTDDSGVVARPGEMGPVDEAAPHGRDSSGEPYTEF